MALEPKTGLTLWDDGIMQPDLLFNDLLLWTAIWAQAVVLSIEDAPPGSPADGDMHLVGTGSGLFAGHDDDLAYWDDAAGVWLFYAPGEGYSVWNLDDDSEYRFATVGGWTAPGGGGGGGASVGVQYLADTGSTADSDPGPGLMKWNNATQASATFLYLDDDTDDGVSLTAWWAALDAGGFCYLQHATDQDTWQIWEITAITDATGYVKLAVTLLANGGSFADGDPMLVTLEQGVTSTTFTGGALSSALNEAKGTNIASAGTTDIGAATGNLVHVTGTTTITALGTVQAGTRRVVVFDGILTLTHNGTSLILPTAANITTAAGDSAVFVSEGSGNWKCVNYERASGAALVGSASRTPAVQSVVSSSTVTPTFSDDIVLVTAQAVALALANPTGTAIPNLGMVIRIKDNGTARAISYDTQYRAIGVTLPATTVISKTTYLAMIYNGTDTKWDVVAVGQEA